MKSLASSASGGVSSISDGRDQSEQVAGGGGGVRLKSGNDLRQLDQLFDGVAFCDALRAKRQQDLAVQPAQALVNQLGDARINGAAKDQQRAVLHVVEQCVDAAIDVADGRIQVTVDRRTHDGDDRVGGVEAGGIERRV